MKKKAKAKAPSAPKAAPATGTYRYDEKLGKVVKVSDDIPGISSDGFSAGDSGPMEGGCGRSACGGGACAEGGGD